MSDHTPHWNASNGQDPWTAEEDAAILAFRAQGLTTREIRMKMPKRTEAAIKNRLTIMRVGLDVIRKRQRERRASKRKAFPINHVVEPRIIIPPEVLEDRNRRSAAPRSLTAAIYGDPEPGRPRL